MLRIERSDDHPDPTGPVEAAVDDALSTLESVVADHGVSMRATEVGRIASIAQGVAQVRGLPGVGAEELVRIHGGLLGLAFDLQPEEVGVVLLGSSHHVAAGSMLSRTGRILDVPVGEALLGRVVDALGQPLDERGPLPRMERRPVERPAPPTIHRAAVSAPLQTGLKVIDALLPIGRGQRELILGDRQTGKTALALDAILNQHDTGVICVYCAIGQRSSAVAKLLDTLRRHDALRRTIVVVAAGDAPPGVQYVAPYAATTMAEYFAERGRDVLIVYDDLTRHARAYRELCLLLRRPPGREAYPGDIFYLHARLLERSTHLCDALGGGSLTALPIIETQAQNLSAYVPTNLISITDGQIVTSSTLFRKGILPAVDVGRSVSRVGGKAQLPSLRAVAGELRLSYAQFEELEIFSRFGTRLDEETRRTLIRGQRIREVLKQPQYEPMKVSEQVAVLLAAGEGCLDGVPLELVASAERGVRRAMIEQHQELCDRLQSRDRLHAEDREILKRVALGAAALQGRAVDADA